MMKTVYQTPDEPDCGAACIAMLLGCTLSSARKRIYGDNKPKKTKVKELALALSSDLVIEQTKLKPLPGKGLRALGRHALVFGKLSDGNRHWMVWDAAAKCLRDPEGFRQSTTITSHLPVGRPIA